MSARDRHKVKLSCSCGQKGTAYVSDNDGYSFMRSGPQRSIEKMSGNFAWRETETAALYDGGYFFCTVCKSRVEEP